MKYLTKKHKAWALEKAEIGDPVWNLAQARSLMNEWRDIMNGAQAELAHKVPGDPGRHNRLLALLNNSRRQCAKFTYLTALLLRKQEIER